MNKLFKVTTQIYSILAISLVFNFGDYNSVTLAQVMSSANYKIFVDSVNPGGLSSDSSNYRLTDTLGEVGTNETASSTNFKTKAGFEAIELGNILTVNLSKNAINLGVMSPSNVVTDSHTLTVTTNGNGYTTTATSDGNLRTTGGDDIDNVLDGSVTAGSEEYGIRTSGIDGQQNGADTAITPLAKDIAKRVTTAVGVITTINYRAAVTTGTPFGNYNQIISYSTTGNF